MTAQAFPISSPPAATILVVDDEPFLRVVLPEALNEAGYHAIEAENADVAEQMLQTHPNIDVLITDINLDCRLDGHQVALKAYSLFPYLKVILMSGDLIAGEQGASKSTVADGFLHKPFQLEDMWNLVESLLRLNPPVSIQ